MGAPWFASTPYKRIGILLTRFLSTLSRFTSTHLGLPSSSLHLFCTYGGRRKSEGLVCIRGFLRFRFKPHAHAGHSSNFTLWASRKGNSRPTYMDPCIVLLEHVHLSPSSIQKRNKAAVSTSRNSSLSLSVLGYTNSILSSPQNESPPPHTQPSRNHHHNFLTERPWFFSDIPSIPFLTTATVELKFFLLRRHSLNNVFIIFHLWNLLHKMMQTGHLASVSFHVMLSEIEPSFLVFLHNPRRSMVWCKWPLVRITFQTVVLNKGTCRSAQIWRSPRLSSTLCCNSASHIGSWLYGGVHKTFFPYAFPYGSRR